MNTFSDYQISWLVLKPLDGKATKRDQLHFNKCLGIKRFCLNFFEENTIVAHYPDIDKAKADLAKLTKANKAYKAYIITDRQRVEDANPTEMQLKNSIIL